MSFTVTEPEQLKSAGQMVHVAALLETLPQGLVTMTWISRRPPVTAVELPTELVMVTVTCVTAEALNAGVVVPGWVFTPPTMFDQTVLPSGRHCHW